MQSLPSCRRQHLGTLDYRPVIIARFIGYMHSLVLSERINQKARTTLGLSLCLWLTSAILHVREAWNAYHVCLACMHACSFELQRAPSCGCRTRATVPEVLPAEHNWARSRMDACALKTVRTHYTCPHEQSWHYAVYVVHKGYVCALCIYVKFLGFDTYVLHVEFLVSYRVDYSAA